MEHAPPRRCFLLEANARHTAACDDADEATRVLVTWLYHHVVGHDVFPRRLPADVKEVVERLADAQRRQRAAIAGPADEVVGLLLRFAAGGNHAVPYSREEFYLFRALDIIARQEDSEYAAYLSAHAAGR